MKKIIIATICIYGIPAFAMQVDEIQFSQERLSAFGVALCTVERTLRPNCRNRGDILEATEALSPALNALTLIETSLPSPVDVHLNRRIAALRHRIGIRIGYALKILSDQTASLNNRMALFDGASDEEQEDMMGHLNFLTQLYNIITSEEVVGHLDDQEQERLRDIHASLAQMRMGAGL